MSDIAMQAGAKALEAAADKLRHDITVAAADQKTAEIRFNNAGVRVLALQEELTQVEASIDALIEHGRTAAALA